METKTGTSIQVTEELLGRGGAHTPTGCGWAGTRCAELPDRLLGARERKVSTFLAPCPDCLK